MRESRTLENEKFERFFDLVRKEAAKKNSIFFIHCGEGHELFSQTLEGEDLSGWLIPMQSVDEFEPAWKNGDIPEKWDDLFCFAEWSGEPTKISIKFNRYN